MKKSKKEKNSLYNFNLDDEKNNKIKRKSKLSKKEDKKVKKENKDKKSTSTFDFNNEIVIGLARIEDEKKSKKNNKDIKRRSKTTSKSKIKKQDKKTTKNNEKNKNKDKKIIKKTSKLKGIKKDKRKKNKQFSNMSINEQDIILETNKTQQNKNPKKMKVLKYSFLVICIIVAIIAAMMSPLFNIKEIIVTGNEKLTQDEIISLSQININENTYRTNMGKSKKKILENPYVNNVKIKRVLPDKVEVIVEERKPTFMIEYGSGYAYINNQGYILEISDEKLEVPIIQGAQTLAEDFIPGKRLYNEDLNKMSTVIKIMEIAENNEIAHLITRIDIENKLDYKIVFETEEKVAYIGDDSDLNTKILSVKSILEKENGIAGEIFVNMDLKNNYPTFRQSV